MEEFNYRKLLHQDFGNGIYLNGFDIELLEKYHIPYQTCKSLSELSSLIENSNIEDEELEYLEVKLAEIHYYCHVDK